MGEPAPATGPEALPKFIALLRGINVGGHNRVPMAELRALCGGLGWAAVRTYIQSGNVVFRAARPAPDLEAGLEAAIESRFGLAIPVVVRPATRWEIYAAANPFPAESGVTPNLVMLGLSKAPPASGAVDRLREHVAGGEAVDRSGDALWIRYDRGAGRSRLTPALLDRAVGSPVTLRNWRTVLRIREMACG
jgi:uncharacterized protein (DUF1697 family)